MKNDIMNKTGVYEIRNKVNGKVYYGSAALNFKNRKKDHWNALKANRHDNKHLQDAWNKYGQDAFEFKIVLFCHQDLCAYYEQFYLDMCFDGSTCCYNICPDATNCAGRKDSNETREKKRVARLGEKNPFYGQKHSDETRAVISSKAMGKIVSLETRKKMSDSKKGKPPGNAGQKWNRGRYEKGKLTWQKVEEIRFKYETGTYTCKALAEEYSVHPTNIGYIVKNKTWVSKE